MEELSPSDQLSSVPALPTPTRLEISTNTVENWEGKIQSELMEMGGGRGHIPMILLLHVSRKRERNVPFKSAKLFPKSP